MNKGELIVGGIYEFDFEHEGNITSIVVIDINNIDEQEVYSDRVIAKSYGISDLVDRVFYPMPQFITQQIGFNATYTDEHKKLQADLEQQHDLIECCKKLKAKLDTDPSYQHRFNAVFYKSLPLLQIELELGLQGIKNKMADLKSTSWMQGESNE